jgi:hypothetical protein
MPELRLKDLRLPDFHLPEMSRDDIARTINDARSEIDLGKIDLNRFDPRSIDRPDIDVSRKDIERFVTSAAENAGLITVSRRPRPAFVVGIAAAVALIVAAAIAAIVIRPRLAEARRRATEERADETLFDAEMYASEAADELDGHDDEATEPTAVSTEGDRPTGELADPVAIPIDPSAFSQPDTAERALN